MQGFSIARLHLDKFEQQVEEEKELQPAPPWSKEESTAERRRERVRRSHDDFWYFWRTYFPPELYQGGHAEPCEMHRDIIDLMQHPGVHEVLGFRGGGKTVITKQGFAWLFLTLRRKIGGTLSQHMLVSTRILRHVHNIIALNPRIAFDFGITVLKRNEDEFHFRVHQPGERPVTCYISAFSEDRSLRGYTEDFARPEVVIGDDFETRTSPIGPDHTQKRIAFVAEAKSSLSDDGVILMLGNNFDEESMANFLLTQQEEGTLSKGWHVHVYPAWDDVKGSAWPQKYPATSEAEMRALLEPANDAEWDGDYMQRPNRPRGEVFGEEFYTEYDHLPADIRGVIYTDQNLALKSKGDTTGIFVVTYSPSEDAVYVLALRCRSYSDPDDLLNDVFAERRRCIIAIGFDGNFGQESSWTYHVRAYSRDRGILSPNIEYKRYHIDELATNVQGLWIKRKIRFPRGYKLTEEGKRALKQIYQFTTKKAKRKDDAPDSMIGGIEMLHEKRIVRRRSKPRRPVAVEDAYKPF